ncbi:hypothetical protein MVEG_08595 [Podila verticillata NRRL 6337]|nr:hypothetical protein MVEG_08595 [Podila verticillata NRRL 6337]
MFATRNLNMSRYRTAKQDIMGPGMLPPEPLSFFFFRSSLSKYPTSSNQRPFQQYTHLIVFFIQMELLFLSRDRLSSARSFIFFEMKVHPPYRQFYKYVDFHIT